MSKTYSSIYIDMNLVQRVMVLAGPDYLDRSANYLYVKAIEEWVKQQEAKLGIEVSNEQDDGHNSEDPDEG